MFVACRPCLYFTFLPPSPPGKDRPPGKGGANLCRRKISPDGRLCGRANLQQSASSVDNCRRVWYNNTQKKIQNAEENGKPCKMCNAGRS